MPATRKSRFSLDPVSGWLLIDGQPLPLQFKAQAVLSEIVRKAPKTVSRQELIDAIWSGNFLTGDKGVRQSMWAIRAALGDDAVTPRYVRTVPRVGYQWVGETVTKTQPARSIVGVRPRVLARFVVALTVAVFVATLWRAPLPLVHASPEVANATLRGNRIVIDYDTGCRRVLVPDDRASIVGTPIVSDDRKQVVFRVEKDEACRLLTFELESDAVRKFDSCPGHSRKRQEQT